MQHGVPCAPHPGDRLHRRVAGDDRDRGPGHPERAQRALDLAEGTAQQRVVDRAGGVDHHRHGGVRTPPARQEQARRRGRPPVGTRPGGVGAPRRPAHPAPDGLGEQLLPWQGRLGHPAHPAGGLAGGVAAPALAAAVFDRHHLADALRVAGVHQAHVGLGRKLPGAGEAVDRAAVAVLVSGVLVGLGLGVAGGQAGERGPVLLGRTPRRQLPRVPGAQRPGVRDQVGGRHPLGGQRVEQGQVGRPVPRGARGAVDPDRAGPPGVVEQEVPQLVGHLPGQRLDLDRRRPVGVHVQPPVLVGRDPRHLGRLNRHQGVQAAGEVGEPGAGVRDQPELGRGDRVTGAPHGRSPSRPNPWRPGRAPPPAAARPAPAPTRRP